MKETKTPKEKSQKQKNVGRTATFSAVILTVLTLATFFFLPSSPPKDATVMVYDLTKNIGGSGVILNSYNSHSEILTNSHVCNVVKDGGYVKTAAGKEYTVTNFKQDTVHDICMIVVTANLNIDTKLATEEPREYSSAVISGHPALLPVVNSYGHFSKKEFIDIVVATRTCTMEDYQNPDTSYLCAFFNIVPTIKKFESTVVTALIQGGSSGSAVYNSSNELSGLVFAGHSGGLSYAFIVPYSYLAQFLTKYNRLKARAWGVGKYATWPDYIYKPIKQNNQEKDLYKKMLTKCEKSPKELHESVKKVCSLLNKGRTW